MWKNAEDSQSSRTRTASNRALCIQPVVAQLLREGGIDQKEMCRQCTIWDEVLARRGRGSCRCGDSWVVGATRTRLGTFYIEDEGKQSYPDIPHLDNGVV